MKLINADDLRETLLHRYHGKNKSIVPYSDRKGYRQRDREVDEAIINAPTVLTIPENPTNGDMIRAMFPNINIEEGSKYVLLESEYDNVAIWNSWWNAPYKKGGDIE